MHKQVSPPSDVQQTYRAARDAAVTAAGRAARLIRARAGQVAEEEVREKGIHDLLTRTDEEAQALIIEELQRAFPAFDVLAEEGAEETEWAAEVEGFRWIIDPIDGTTNFTHGVPPYAVSIALQHGDRIVAGVVLDVAADELFTAVRSEGLRMNGRPAEVSSTDTLDAALVATGFPYRSFEYLDTYLEVLGRMLRRTRGVRRHGSAAIDLAYVACGRFGAFYERGLDPWDTAAGALLVEEAGGRATDFRGSGDSIFTGQTLATNGFLHAPLRELVDPLRDVTV